MEYRIARELLAAERDRLASSLSEDCASVSCDDCERAYQVAVELRSLLRIVSANTVPQDRGYSIGDAIAGRDSS
jgi:hypothetical protein